MKCSNCGIDIKEDAKFCPGCGSPVVIMQENQNGETQGYGEPFSNAQYAYNRAVNTGMVQNVCSVPVRNIATSIILTFVTCSIYYWFWLARLVDDFNATLNERQETSGVLVSVFTIISCGIYGAYWMYNAGNKLDSYMERNGRSGQNRGLTYLLLSLFTYSILPTALIQKEINNINEGRMY